MARSAPAAKQPETPGILPVAEAVVLHHAQTLYPPMREWRKARRVPPVLLLTGTSGVGKREMVWHLAQWLLCERAGFARQAESDESEGMLDMFGGGASSGGASNEAPHRDASLADESDPRPCGECASCQRALHGNWVDFTEILPEEEDTGGALKIDQFRKLKSSIGFGAHEGAFRIVAIPNADRMTAQAANSVLKLLEEPPKGWVFFLTASDPTLVLPTVLSRCQQLRLKPFSRDEIEKILSSMKMDPARRAACAELAQGSWRKSLALLGDENWENRGTIIELLKHPGQAAGPLIEWAAVENSHFGLLIDQVESLLADLIRWSATASPASSYAWRNEDAKSALATHAQATVKRLGSIEAARSFWLERTERLARARAESLAPLNRKLLVQDLLLPWLG